VYTLSSSFRFGSNIAAVVNTYLQNSMYPGMLSRYDKRMLTANTYSSTYTNKAVIAPCTDTVVTGAAAYDGIIHSANSSNDDDGDNEDLQVPYTILCASNKGVLEAAMSVLNLDDLLSVQSMSQEADSSISSDSQSCNAKVMDTSAMTKQSQHGTQAPAAAFDLDTVLSNINSNVKLHIVFGNNGSLSSMIKGFTELRKLQRHEKKSLCFMVQNVNHYVK
jgi:uncharacterized protein YfcZ (UPF0381/DUF406 family)